MWKNEVFEEPTDGKSGRNVHASCELTSSAHATSLLCPSMEFRLKRTLPKVKRKNQEARYTEYKIINTLSDTGMGFGSLENRSLSEMLDVPTTTIFDGTVTGMTALKIRC